MGFFGGLVDDVEAIFDPRHHKSTKHSRQFVKWANDHGPKTVGEGLAIAAGIGAAAIAAPEIAAAAGIGELGLGGVGTFVAEQGVQGAAGTLIKEGLKHHLVRKAIFGGTALIALEDRITQHGIHSKRHTKPKESFDRMKELADRAVKRKTSLRYRRAHKNDSHTRQRELHAPHDGKSNPHDKRHHHALPKHGAPLRGHINERGDHASGSRFSYDHAAPLQRAPAKRRLESQGAHHEQVRPRKQTCMA
jgi:hypothetical protein